MSDPLETLSRGEILLFPTDTLYGLGVDALNVEAIKKLKELKGRSEIKKPISIIVYDLEMAGKYADVTELAKRLSEKFLPGKLTLVLKAKDNLPEELTAATGTIGIRIPHHTFCLNLAKEFGKPFTATSANKAGEDPEQTVPDILEQLGERAELISQVVDAGELLESPPSTVIDARGSTAVILREGAISREEIIR